MDQPVDPPVTGRGAGRLFPRLRGRRSKQPGARVQGRVDQLREGGELLRPATPHEFGRPHVTEHEFANRTFLVAQVQPLDVTGVRTIGFGGVLWLVAFVAMLPFYSALQDSGRLWWLWTCLAGACLGLIGWLYTRRRRTHLRGQ